MRMSDFGLGRAAEAWKDDLSEVVIIGSGFRFPASVAPTNVNGPLRFFCTGCPPGGSRLRDISSDRGNAKVYCDPDHDGVGRGRVAS